MTLQQVIDKARRIARVDDTGKLDSEVMDCVNESMKVFVRRVHDVVKGVYLDVTPSFNTSEFMAVCVTIVGGANEIPKTDITAEVARNDATGAALAGYLQTRVNAAIVAAGGAGTVTIAWDADEWIFIATVPGATTVTIEPPMGKNYHDASCIVGMSGTQSGTTFTGSVPHNITTCCTLPTDFLALMGPPEWCDEQLQEAPFEHFIASHEMGTPSHYFILNGKIRLYPAPDKQGAFRLIYRYWPTEFTNVSGYQECGIDVDYTDTLTATAGLHSVGVSVDGATSVNVEITLPTDPQWNAVLKLLNAATTGATWSLEDGDLRCTSDTEAVDSSIGLSAGSSGTNFLTTISATLGTAVAPQYTTDVPIDDNYCMAIVYHVASQLLEESFEQDRAMHCLGQFQMICQDYQTTRMNENTSIFPKAVKRGRWEVEPFAD